MILITGGDRQLAREFSRFFELRAEKFLAPKRCELDIVNFSKVAKFVKKNGEYLVSDGVSSPTSTLDFTPYDIRPKYSKLSSSKIEELLDIKIPSWKERIDQYLSVDI
ncbi:MAG: hypothetical protein ACRDAS_00165 [Cetobacterium sp.]